MSDGKTVTPGFIPKYSKPNEEPVMVDVTPEQETLPDVEPEAVVSVATSEPQEEPKQERKLKDRSAPNPNPKPRVSRPWKPASLLSVKKRPGFRLRWCSESQLPKREAEGWVIVQDGKGGIVRKPFQDKTVLDTSGVTSAVRIRELILMEMPEAMAKSREKYFRELDAGQKMSAIEKLKKDTRVAGSKSAGAYGTITVQPGDEVQPPDHEDED